jgi:hypothetical protein
MTIVYRQLVKIVKHVQGYNLLRRDSLLMCNRSDQAARRHTTRPHLEDGRRKAECYHSTVTIHSKLSWTDSRNSTILDRYGYTSGIEYPADPGMSVEPANLPIMSWAL